ncbi:MAG: hypothetical protein ACON4M_08525 [Crocinitomicaceae bacterium]
MKWIGERISFVDDKEVCTIVIYPKRQVIVNGLMGAWLAMWLVIGVVTLWSFSTYKFTDQESIILFVFIVFWAYYAWKVIKSFFWLMWGKELIKINDSSFIYKKSIKNYGKANNYFIENIEKIRVHQPKPNSFQAAWESSPWIQGGERIEFDYQNKLIRVGRKLEEKDTQQLFKFMTKKIEDRLKKLK